MRNSISINGIFDDKISFSNSYIGYGGLLPSCWFGFEFKPDLDKEPLQEKYAFERGLKATTPKAQDLLEGGFYDSVDIVSATTSMSTENDNENQAPSWSSDTINT